MIENMHSTKWQLNKKENNLQHGETGLLAKQNFFLLARISVESVLVEPTLQDFDRVLREVAAASTRGTARVICSGCLVTVVLDTSQVMSCGGHLRGAHLRSAVFTHIRQWHGWKKQESVV